MLAAAVWLFSLAALHYGEGSLWLAIFLVILALAAWIYIAPPGLMGKLDAVGYAVCHRLDSHSLHAGDTQLPEICV